MIDLARARKWDKIFDEFTNLGIEYTTDKDYNIEFDENRYDEAFSIISKYFPEYKLN